MSRKARRTGGRQQVVKVTAIGARGDGLASDDATGQPVFVPFSLPGETLSVKLLQTKSAGSEAQPLELIEASSERVDPPCPHFGLCGGCQLQHWQQDAYQAWKQERLKTSLERAGFADPLLRPLVQAPEHSRRRATLSAEKPRKGAVRLGFRARASSQLVHIESCAILRPKLFESLEPLRHFAERLLEPGESAKFQLCETDSGLDLQLLTDRKSKAPDMLAVSELVEVCDLARLVWNDEPVLTRREPMLRLGAEQTFAQVTIPPGAFLQASSTVQDAMVAALLEALPDDLGKVADLFSGLGSFTLPLLARARQVLAVEGDGPAIDALELAVRRHQLADRLSIERRDLEAWPLQGLELGKMDAVIFDPPRAGARAQAPHIAAARVPLVVAISCNPATLQRDLVPFAQAGYRLEWAQAFDQFLWSAHVEAMAVLRLDPEGA